VWIKDGGFEMKRKERDEAEEGGQREQEVETKSEVCTSSSLRTGTNINQIS
jgi:hypothetical protein